MSFEKFKEDFYSQTQHDWSFVEGVLRILKNKTLRFCLYGRVSCTGNVFFSSIAKLCIRRYRKYGVEINFDNIGGGLLLLHPYGITVNPKAILGNNVTLFKGVTIGSIRSGKRAGVPQIGDRVVLCVNSSVLGNAHIGSDVLITANTMVDFDVPDHSIVIGNPGIIHHKENASKDYMSGV